MSALSDPLASTRAFLVDNLLWLRAGVVLSFPSSFGQIFFLSIFAGEIRVEFGLGHGEWGTIYSIGTGISVLVMIWAGMLTGVMRVRRLGPLILTAWQLLVF